MTKETGKQDPNSKPPNDIRQLNLGERHSRKLEYLRHELTGIPFIKDAIDRAATMPIEQYKMRIEELFKAWSTFIEVVNSDNPKLESDY